MRHRPLRSLAAVLAATVALVGTVVVWPPAAGHAAELPVGPNAEAWILVDADTGVVLDAHNASTPRLVASTTKLLTALVVRRYLDPNDTVVVSERAAAMPPRKLDVRVGDRWRVEDLLYGLLLSSANDVAAVLAEGSGGSLEGFSEQLAAAAAELGLSDHPAVPDPSGLDDGDSVGGGNRLSARDLAIVARAALADPLLARIVATPRYEFVDPAGKQRSLGNHNKMLASYPGTIGMKTGYTSRAGQCLVAAATRDGRTLISVVLGAASLYGDSIVLLERGLAMAPKAIGTGDQLPEVVPLGRLVPEHLLASGQSVPEGAAVVAGGQRSLAGRVASHPLVQLVMMLVGLVAGLRARVKVRRARRARRRDQRRSWHHHPSTQGSVRHVRPLSHPRSRSSSRSTRLRVGSVGDNPVDNPRRGGDNLGFPGDLLGISRQPIDRGGQPAHAGPSRLTTSRGDTSAAFGRRRPPG